MADGQVKNHAEFIWSAADLLRGDYKQSDYGKVILPLTVLRRFRTAGRRFPSAGRPLPCRHCERG